jgi:hypothetical protein
MGDQPGRWHGATRYQVLRSIIQRRLEAELMPYPNSALSQEDRGWNDGIRHAISEMTFLFTRIENDDDIDRWARATFPNWLADDCSEEERITNQRRRNITAARLHAFQELIDAGPPEGDDLDRRLSDALFGFYRRRAAQLQAELDEYDAEAGDE